MKAKKVHVALAALLIGFCLAAATVSAEEPENPEGVESTEENGNTETGNDAEPAGDVPVSQILLSQDTLQISALEAKYTVSASVNADATDPTLSWASDHPEIVSVASASDGTVSVTAHRSGKAVITVTANDGSGKTAKMTVTVSKLLNGVYKDPSGATADAFYYKNGLVQNITDVKKIGGAWYNLKKGKVEGNTVAKNSKGWWYINSNGKVDFHYNGTGRNQNGCWVIRDGKVDFSVNDIIKTKVDGVNGWWYVRGGEVKFSYTGVAKNKNGWWRVSKGKVDFNCNSVEKNSNGWWVIRDGKVDFKYKGFAENKNGWWYCKGGKVQFGTNDVIKGTVNGKKAWWYVVKGEVTFTDTVAKNADGWWRIEDGKVNFNCDSVEKNKNGWWYIRDGKVNFKYNGFAENKNGWWYCKGGKVQFGTNDVIKGTVKGKKAWWYVVKGEVTFTDTVAKNKNGWWRIEDGKVNFNCNSVEKNHNGWWYIRDGKVDFGYTGVAKNADGWWRIEDGKVNFKFNGIATNSNGAWYIVDGKVDFDYSGTVTWKGQRYEVIQGEVQNYINFIKKYVYVKYRSGGTSPSGWDCSGFTQWAMKQMGIKISRLAADQAKGGIAINVKDRSKWKPGDILVYSSGGRVNHVALYLGNNQLMHALNAKYGTVIHDVDYYEKWDKKNTLTGVRRY